MGFSQDTVEVAWERAEGKCECGIGFHQHLGGCCNETLDWDKRGIPEDMRERGHWEAYHLDEHPTNNTVDNCAIFCWRCYERTF